MKHRHSPRWSGRLKRRLALASAELRWSLQALLFLVVLGLAGAEQPVEVVYRDGTRLEGRRFERLHSWSQQDKDARIDGKKIFEKPVRRLVDHNKTPRLVGPFLEFANGDRLVGLMTGFLPADPARSLPARLNVSADTSFDRHQRSAQVEVRLDRVTRLVNHLPGQPLFKPGAVWLADGRRLTARAVRWRTEGIRVLTEAGPETIPFTELHEIHMPRTDGVEAVLADLKAPSLPQGGDSLMVLELANGSRLTCLENRVRPHGHHGWYHPAWASSAIQIDWRAVGAAEFRALDRIPLSALPAETLSEKNFTGFTWHWRRDAAVTGAALQVGREQSGVGIGTHSYSAIAFELPDAATNFHARVGIDASSGEGGCAVCSVYADELDGEPLWQSDHLVGGTNAAVEVNIPLVDAERIILVTDYGHEGRPEGADPFDIRDSVSWLDAAVQLSSNAIAVSEADVAFVSDEWTISQPERLTPHVSWWDHRKQYGLGFNIEGKEPLRLTRRAKIGYQLGQISIEASRTTRHGPAHEIGVLINGEGADSALNGNVKTDNADPGKPDQRVWWLGEYMGEEVEIVVEIRPAGEKSSPLLLEQLQLAPIIEDLDAGGELLVPDLGLVGLKPAEALLPPGDRIRPGHCANGVALEMRSIRFEDGFGLRGGSAVTYPLDPTYKRFVAVIGLADGWQDLGYAIDLDGEQVWNDCCFGRTRPMRQIDFPIPAGHTNITLRVVKDKSYGAFGNAGFMK